MTLLRCPSTLHAVGSEDGKLTRHCRDCSKERSRDEGRAVLVYHCWQFVDADWRHLDDQTVAVPQDVPATSHRGAAAHARGGA